ncbi:helix-turn-helix domain-containing protein [Chryseobacterium aureum]|uniref:helix-turn-helix domain-containing protein n=1 Tax=Chryseobacterium aureum TaxID=2497456 RepID=UPI000F88A3C9|nr:AraC family transcriptional regulator [Chryseobacterium aureum]
MKKKYEIIIKNIKEKIHHSVDSIQESEDEQDIIVAISEETVQSILFYLKQFEREKKFNEKKVNLSYLANYANTNIRYLNEVLKKHKKKSFSKYINGLRIKYITKLLYKEPKYREYKITYLAELCGFSSRQVFTSVFRKETGLTTSYFIKQLKSDRDTPDKISN